MLKKKEEEADLRGISEGGGVAGGRLKRARWSPTAKTVERLKLADMKKPSE